MRREEPPLSIFIIKSSDIEACPKKSMSPGHYRIDGTGCKCVPPEPELPLRKKQDQAIAEHPCPVCGVQPGSWCLSQATSRIAPKPLKKPHPERVQLVDPSLAGYRKRKSRSSAEWKAGTMSSPKRRRKGHGWSDE